MRNETHTQDTYCTVHVYTHTRDGYLRYIISSCIINITVTFVPKGFNILWKITLMVSRKKPLFHTLCVEGSSSTLYYKQFSQTCVVLPSFPLAYKDSCYVLAGFLLYCSEMRTKTTNVKYCYDPKTLNHSKLLF